MPYKSGRRKKKRTQSFENNDVLFQDDDKVPPRCLIIKKSKVGKHIKQLLNELKDVMSPNVPHKIKESKNEKMKSILQLSK